MLHQTLPLFFHFDPSKNSSATSHLHLLSLSPSSQIKPEMDCVEAKALRTSLGPEMTVKSGQQSILDDGLGGNGTNVLAGDDFSVDDLLDFSNEDVEKGFVEEEKDSLSVSSQDGAENDNSNSGTFSFKDDDFGSIPGDELSVPTDDIADLEWLSHFFVDDSFMEFPVPCQTVNQKQKSQNQTQNQDEPKTKKISPERPCFPAIIPAKARSKRLRTGGRVWSLGSPSLTDSSSTSSSSSSTSSSPTSSLVLTNRDLNLELFFSYGKPPPAKKQKKKNLPDAGGSLPQRRCSHCHVQKTPQWRTGPLGAKTLCNACGVRFKSGRLLPEYRPAISPTFSSEVHSNNHRKVLEMRRKKETVGPESGLPLPVQSF